MGMLERKIRDELNHQFKLARATNDEIVHEHFIAMLVLTTRCGITTEEECQKALSRLPP